MSWGLVPHAQHPCCHHECTDPLLLLWIQGGDMATTRLVTVAVVQMECSPQTAENVERAESLVRRAAKLGAKVVLLPELFATRYFCQEQSEKNFLLAESEESSLLLKRFQRLAAELGTVGTDRRHATCAHTCVMMPQLLRVQPDVWGR